MRGFQQDNAIWKSIVFDFMANSCEEAQNYKTRGAEV